MKRLTPAIVLSLLGAAAVVGTFIVVTNHLRPEPIVLPRPAAGDARADYLPDGTPVWVVGHGDGSASMLAGFDTHRPFGIGKLLWWCESAGALENPHHGSKWDEYGRRLGGPAPRDLASWTTQAVGSQVALGAQRTLGAAPDPLGPPESEREWCAGEAPDATFHTFDGWELWTSPTAAIAAAPTGWILLEGLLEFDPDDRPILCALDGCDDAALAVGVETVEPALRRGDFSPFGRHDRFIAEVRDGALVNLTRVVWPNPD
jgi:hypothetical protein